MKKIEAIIRKSKFEDVKEALYKADIDWFSVFQSRYIQRRMLSIVDRDINLKKTVEAILKAAWTGEMGDGKVFVYDIEETYRIRTGESGPEALYNKNDEKKI